MLVAVSLLVFAAASTTEAMEEIGREFKATAGEEVTFSFGASSALARQIEAGAPADVFLSADFHSMNQLEKAGLVRRSSYLLGNQLVIVVPSGSTAAVTDPKDLVKLSRIALADPSAVPAGRYAKEWLEKLGLWDEVQPKIVPTMDVRAALAAVESERAGAGIVYRTDAAAAKKVRVAYSVPVGQGPAIVYPVAAITARGAAFVSFLTGAKAKAIFDRHGFLTR